MAVAAKMFAFILLWIHVSSSLSLLGWEILITLREGKMTLGVLSRKTGFRLRVIWIFKFWVEVFWSLKDGKWIHSAYYILNVRGSFQTKWKIFADDILCSHMLTFGRFQVKSEIFTVLNGPVGIQTKVLFQWALWPNIRFLWIVGNFTTAEKPCLPALLLLPLGAERRRLAPLRPEVASEMAIEAGEILVFSIWSSAYGCRRDGGILLFQLPSTVNFKAWPLFL